MKPEEPVTRMESGVESMFWGGSQLAMVGIQGSAIATDEPWLETDYWPATSLLLALRLGNKRLDGALS